MSAPAYNRLRTRSPSPGRIFAASTTPIVIDSSPSISYTPSSFRCAIKDPGNLDANEVHSPCFPKHPQRINGPLSLSPGRENIPLFKTPQGRKNGGKEGIPTMAIDGELPYQYKSDKRVDESHESNMASRDQKQEENGTRKTRKTKNLANMKLAGRSTKAFVNTTSKALLLQDREALKSEQPKGEELPLGAATTRRGSWTPTKDTKNQAAGTGNNSSLSPSAILSMGEPRFSSILSGYEFSKDSSSSSTNVEHPGDGPTRKTPLELFQRMGSGSGVEGSSVSSGKKISRSNSTKARRPRKTKATTITSLSTAQYELRASSDDQSPFKLSPLNDPATVTTAKQNTSARAVKSKAKKAPKSKAQENAKFQVASATEALKTIQDQAFIFGTCSQLEQSSLAETSHTPEPEEQQVRLPQKRPYNKEVGTPLSKYTTSKNYWSACFRDLGGSVTEIEVLDMVDSGTPQPLKDFVLVPDADSLPSSRAGAPREPDCSPVCESTMAARPDRSDITKSGVDLSCNSMDNIQDTEICGSGAESALVVAVETQSTSCPKPKPNFRGLSSAELTQKVASFGFKTLKNREKMISLLEKCWESQQQTQTSSPLETNQKSLEIDERPNNLGRRVSDQVQTEPETTVEETSLAQPKTRSSSKVSTCSQRISKSTNSGKRQRCAIPASQPILVIPDSDDGEDNTQGYDFDSTRSPLAIFNTDLPFTPLETLAQKEPQSTVARSAGGHQEIPTDIGDICQQITKAIKAQPRLKAASGMKRPTWFEKILMYDPIILDDLTVWLNTEGLDRIGEDREVNRLTVREWCEGKGICCTWKKIQGIPA